jgi:hypothetical protein
MARTGVHRRCAVTGGHTDASVCAPDAGTARTAVADVAARDVALWTRSGAWVHLYFLIRFSNLIFSSFLN